MYFTENKDELQHHGILGQKWGIRRFQNKDGTRTEAGKKRAREENTSSGENNASSGIDKKKLAKGAAVVGAVAVSAALIAHPATRTALAKYGKTTVSNLTNVEKATALGTKLGTKAGKVTAEAEKAMVKAALASVGSIAISKISNKIKADENATEFEKAKTKVTRDAVAAGIRSVTGGNGNNPNNGNGGGKLNPNVKEKVGEPSGKPVDKQSSKWQSLFNDSNGNPRDKETKNQIREMARQGYDIDQIDKYLIYGEFEEWASKYMAVEIGR